MEYTPKISVIIPIFNPSNLNKCLESVLKQTLSEIEIICVNDGSSTFIAEYLNSISSQDPRVVVVNQQNKGVSASRNVGIQCAKGEYITFIDHDDWIEPDLYKHTYALATQYDVDLVQWGYYMTMPEEKDALYFGSSTEGFYLGDEAKLKFLESKPHWPPVWRRLYKASIIKNNNILFNENLKHGGEDASFNIDLLPYINRLYDINKGLYHWCRKNDGILLSRRATSDLLDDLCSRAVKYGKILSDLRCYGYNLQKDENYKYWAECRINSLTEQDMKLSTDPKVSLFRDLAGTIDKKINDSFDVYKMLEETPVDLVYTYADVSDPSLSLSKSYLKNIENEELRYSIRSILKNIPWIRKIFIFMPNKKVRYLKDEFIDERIVYVSDENIFGLNSVSVIAKEFCLWKLKKYGCAENIIYLNDDYFIGRPLRKSDFFYIENNKVLPYVFYRDLIVERNYDELKKQRDLYMKVKKEKFKHTPELYYTQLLNGYLFLSEALNKKVLRVPLDVRKTMHNAQGFNLTELETIYNLIKNNYKYADDCLIGQHRNEKQITAPVLYDFYFLNKDNRRLSTIDYAFVDLANIDKYKFDHALFCINTGDRFYSDEQKSFARQTLARVFSRKSIYEK